MSRSEPVPGKTVDLLRGIWTVGRKPCFSCESSSLNNIVQWSCQGKRFGAHSSPVPDISPSSQCSSTPKCSPYPHRETLSHSSAAHSTPSLLNTHWLQSPKAYLLCQLPLLTTSEGTTGYPPFPLLHASLHSCFLLPEAQEGWVQRPTCYWGPWVSLCGQKSWFHLMWWLDHGRGLTKYNH